MSAPEGRSGTGPGGRRPAREEQRGDQQACAEAGAQQRRQRGLYLLVQMDHRTAVPAVGSFCGVLCNNDEFLRRFCAINFDRRELHLQTTALVGVSAVDI